MRDRAPWCPSIPAFGVGVFLLVTGAAAKSALPSLSQVTTEQRLDALRRARVREDVDVASRDLYHGPKGSLTFAVDEEIRCDFVPKPIRGWSE